MQVRDRDVDNEDFIGLAGIEVEATDGEGVGEGGSGDVEVEAAVQRG